MDVCHNCSSGDMTPLYRAPAFDSTLYHLTESMGLSRCRSCHIVCTTGASNDAVSGAYTSEYYGSPSRKFMSFIERILAALKTLQARGITQAWRVGQSDARAPAVLDIGCGRGQLLAAFQALGSTVLGLERQEYPAEDPGGNMVQVGAIDDPQYADARFDIIILWHVFEHLEKQDELLDSITEHLSENGLLIIAVPNFGSLQQRMFGKYWFHLDLPRHLVHVESNWLAHALSRRGYTIEAVSHLDTLQNMYGFIQSAMNALAPHRLNDYYGLLKHGLALQPRNALPMLAWSALALLLLPFALLETLLGVLTRKGATVQITARRTNRL